MSGTIWSAVQNLIGNKWSMCHKKCNCGKTLKNHTQCKRSISLSRHVALFWQDFQEHQERFVQLPIVWSLPQFFLNNVNVPRARHLSQLCLDLSICVSLLEIDAKISVFIWKITPVLQSSLFLFYNIVWFLGFPR